MAPPGGDGCSRSGDRVLRRPSALRPGPLFLAGDSESLVHCRQPYLCQRHPRDDDPYNARPGVYGPGGTPVLVGYPDMGKPRYRPVAGHRHHAQPRAVDRAERGPADILGPRMEALWEPVLGQKHPDPGVDLRRRTGHRVGSQCLLPLWRWGSLASQPLAQ